VKGSPLLDGILGGYVPGMAHADVAKHMGSVVPVLVDRTADNNAKTSALARNDLVSLSKHPATRSAVVDAVWMPRQFNTPFHAISNAASRHF